MRASQGFRFGLFLLVSSAACLAQERAVENDQVAGVWRGHSVCMVKNSPCQDEVNVYHISAIPANPSTYFVSGNKVVNGKEEVMGTNEWKYDANAHTLSHEFPRGAFRLKLEGEKMEGDLKLPDGTLYRQIYLQKEK
jgi:hypothetical protein